MWVGLIWAYGQGIGIAQESAQLIKAIKIQGNKRIEAPAIRGRISLKEGEPFIAEKIREQIRAVYQMGYFEDVRVETEPVAGGVAVIFVVTEKPFVTEILYDGNDNVKDEKLTEKLTVRPQSFLDQQQIKDSVERLRLLYEDEGYFSARIVPVIKSLDGERKSLTFFIKEGSRARIKTVAFDGAKAVPVKKLKKALVTREYFWLTSWYDDSGIYKKDELANDMERLRQVYLDEGYLTVQVGTPSVELSPDKQWFTIRFPIIEGPQFTYSQIGYQGQTIFSEQELRTGSKLTPGRVVKMAEIRDEVTRVTDLYGTKGYAFADVNPQILPDPASKTAAVTFEIKEEALVRIRNINISGNDKTRDKVIRRELRVNEAELIDTAAMKRSYERLKNLNYFETVEIIPKQVDPNTVDLDVKVKEKSTGTFSVGGGFSSLDKLGLVADVTEGNLFGRGQLLKVRGQLGQRRSLGVVTFREPYLFDEAVSGQVDLFARETVFLSYFEESIRGDHLPRKRFSGGPLGGTNDFYKAVGDSLWYFPVVWDTVFSPRARLGVAHAYESGSRLPVGDRFFVGGIQTVRGFTFGRAGPTASDFSPLGGSKQLIFNFDYIFPIAPDLKVKGVAFFDYGKGFDDGESLSLNLRPATGFELRWISPFGPLRLAYGFNLHPRTGERPGQFEFSVGTLF